VLTGAGDSAQLSAAGADRLVRTLTQLPNVLAVQLTRASGL
jgi:hypothetical protein